MVGVFVVVVGVTYTGKVIGTEVKLTVLKLIPRYVAVILRAVVTEAWARASVAYSCTPIATISHVLNDFRKSISINCFSARFHVIIPIDILLCDGIEVVLVPVVVVVFELIFEDEQKFPSNNK